MIQNKVTEAKDLLNAGQARRARQVLLQIEDYKKLRGVELLTYFQLLRRVGEYDGALDRLEKIEIRSVDLEIERSILWGEIGALQGAIKNLSQITATDSSTEVSRFFHLGNFYSLQHDYENMYLVFSQMEQLADPNSVYHGVARLNRIGSLVYAGIDAETQIQELNDFAKIISNPLLKQGTYYFTAIAYGSLGEEEKALRFLHQAQSLGVEHRLRESLLLQLTHFELDPQNKRWHKRRLAELRRQVMVQDHVVYFDQFNRLMGQFYLRQNKQELAQTYFIKNIFGDRRNLHVTQSLDLLQPDSIKQAWLLMGQTPKSIHRFQVVRNQLALFDLPAFCKGSRQLLFSSEPLLLQQLTLLLASRLEYGMRLVEVWDQLWGQPFSPQSSLNSLKQLIYRWRQSPFAEYAEIQVEGGRIFCLLKTGSKLFTLRKRSGPHAR